MMFLRSIYIADEGNKTGMGTHLAVILVMDVSQRGLRSSQTKAGSPSEVHGPFKFSTLRLTSEAKKDLSNFELEEAMLAPTSCSSALLPPQLTVNGTAFKSDCLKAKLRDAHSSFYM